MSRPPLRILVVLAAMLAPVPIALTAEQAPAAPAEPPFDASRPSRESPLPTVTPAS
jgi:hypothetical protein